MADITEKEYKGLIKEITIEHYRGFKEKQVLNLADAGGVTFLVGQNNAGKSLIARLFSVFDDIVSGTSTAITRYIYNDFHNLDTSKPIIFSFKLNKEQLSDEWCAKQVEPFKEVIFQLQIKKVEGRVLKFMYIIDDGKKSHIFVEERGESWFKHNEQFSLDRKDSEAVCTNLYLEIKKSILVFNALRSFNLNEQDSSFVTGKELLNHLDSGKKDEIRKNKMRVGELLERLNLDKPVSVDTIKKNEKQLSFDESEIIDVYKPDRLRFTFKDHLELSSSEVGTGYTMLYILLMEIVRNQKKLIIIDEIESHLQPGLIRVLIEQIRKISDAQYIIATHSPTVMDCAQENDYLYHFQKKEGCCSFHGFFQHDKERLYKLRSIANDLGVIPGDALLSNCVIWVEGPSEIFWVRAWLKNYFSVYREKNKLDFNLIEGLHYAILMTGGNLIARINFKEENGYEDEVDGSGINALRVNPNPFVIIDSDGAKRGSEKYKRAFRIAKELNKQNKNHPQVQDWKEIKEDNIDSVENFWQLKGRELENYVHAALLKKFYTEKAKHGNSKISGIEKLRDKDWQVYSMDKGVGKLLEDNEVKGIATKSGTIKHKLDLAKFVFKHLTKEHFEEFPADLLKPDANQIKDLTQNLDQLFDYIVKVNGLV